MEKEQAAVTHEIPSSLDQVRSETTWLPDLVLAYGLHPVRDASIEYTVVVVVEQAPVKEIFRQNAVLGCFGSQPEDSTNQNAHGGDGEVQHGWVCYSEGYWIVLHTALGFEVSMLSKLLQHP